MRKIFLALGAWILAVSGFAVPAKRITTTVVQKDGTSLSVTLCGDEHLHYFLTADEQVVLPSTDGSYYYAELSASRQALVPSAVLAHEASTRTADESKFLATRASVLSSLNTIATAKTQSLRLSQPQQRTKVVGSHKGLVVLVNFTDNAFSMANPHDFYDRVLNEPGYANDKYTGSVHDYFLAQSNGAFDLTFDVVGPVQLDNNIAYYGSNNMAGDDVRPHEMIIEACKAADSLVNFKDYDWNGDGEVDQVFVLYAGYSEASGGASTTIWPHMYALEYATGSKLQLDGVWVNTYACSSELEGKAGTNVDGIGTICHEFSHCLGLPDLYDTGSQGNFGMDAWSLMDYGCYNNDGFTPCNYTSYERWVSGWIEPIVLDKGTTVENMASLSDNGDVYIIYNEANASEYYLLENRQLKGWDAMCGGHGMLVIHVDYDERIWDNNTVNNSSSRQRCTIIPADNKLTQTSLAGDPYPGTSKNTALTNTSTPKASLYNMNSDGNKLMNKPIEDITEKGGLISFKFDGGYYVPAPQGITITDTLAQGFTVAWQPVADAVSYTLKVASLPLGAQVTTELLSDSLAAFYDTKDGSSDLSSMLDKYTQLPGWTGFKVYKGKSGAKIGTSLLQGYLATPAFDFSMGIASVDVELTPYGSDSKNVTVSLCSSEGLEIESVTLTAQAGVLQHIEFQKAGLDNMIKIVPQKRAYVSFISVSDGSTSDPAKGAPAMRSVSELLVEGLTDTHYEVLSLEVGRRYFCTVRAVTAIGESVFSEAAVFDLPDSENALQSIVLQPASGCEVYDMQGRRVAGIDHAAQVGSLPSGFYLVKQGAEVRKVIVR